MKQIFILWVVLILFSANCLADDMIIKLPKPELQSEISIEEALSTRRSRRSYTEEPLTIRQLSQILWAGQGITEEPYFRTAPSAGALYPIDLYIAVNNVTEVEGGLYRYIPEEHYLHQIDSTSYQAKIYSSGLWQEALKSPPVTILLVADYEVITPKYGNRGIRYTFLEAGHIAQNIYLQCESLGLGTVAIGAFDEQGLQQELPVKNNIIYLLPVGRVK